MKFNHLNIPTHWQNYWTRYPEGHTILEALISWVSQVDKMVDNVNNWNDYLDNFVATFDKELQKTVTDTLSDWQQTGFLEVVISEALQWELDDYKQTVDGQLIPLNRLLEAQATVFDGVGDGVTDDTNAFIATLATNDFVFIPKGKIYLIGDVDVVGKTIIGHGTIIKKSSSESAFHVKGDGTVISGLTFKAQTTTGQPQTDIKIGEGATNVSITNNRFNSKIYSNVAGSVDSLNGGIPYYVRAKGLLITGNIFTKSARPVYLHSVDNITINDNIFRECVFDAIRLRENTGYCLIDGNQFIDIGDPTWSDLQTRDAVDVYWSGDTLTMTNNIIRKTAFAGFDVKGVKDNDNRSTKVIIANNQIEGTRFNGIHVYGDVDTDVLYIDSVLIHDNIITGCNQSKEATNGNGIHIKGTAKFVNIHDNIITSNFGRGIYVNNAYQGSENRNIKITGNMCVNNGQSSFASVADAGIHVIGVNGLILADNICEQDNSLPNPHQNTGIYFASVDVASSADKTAIIRGNICRNNKYKQIMIDANTSRANNIAVFSDNIQTGTGAIDRVTWQDQRSVFYGVTFPAPGDGNFRKGDIVYNVAPTPGGNVGWVCVSGGAGGTWKTFGTIEA